MSSPAMLTTRQLVRAFGSLRAVDGVDLEVRANTITGLIGPNGAGKTTLFNLIAGALAPSAARSAFAASRSAACRRTASFARASRERSRCRGRSRG
jgi:ABC-type branched-subunit amino acid transport system ATPase component